MRKILFRGKRTDNGEWAQGYICRYGWIGKEKDYIIPDYVSALYTAEIDPVEWDNDMAKFIITYSTFTVDFDSVCGEELETVGNVYDNPELLKAGEMP